MTADEIHDDEVLGSYWGGLNYLVQPGDVEVMVEVIF